MEIIQCGVRDGRGIPIGKVVVSWRDLEKDRDIAGHLLKLNGTAEAIGHYNTTTIPIEELRK